jgi:hypothetical protein
VTDFGPTVRANEASQVREAPFRAIVVETSPLHSKSLDWPFWNVRIGTVEPSILLKQIEDRIPGFLQELQSLMKATEQILAVPVSTTLTKAVQAQVAVAAEHYGGMLAASANGFGLSAEATARNLFDLVVGTLYLIKNPHLIDDFIEFGQLTIYRLMKNLSPESPQYQQAQAREIAKYAAEMTRLETKFEKKEFLARSADLAGRTGCRHGATLQNCLQNGFRHYARQLLSNPKQGRKVGMGHWFSENQVGALCERIAGFWILDARAFLYRSVPANPNC